MATDVEMYQAAARITDPELREAAARKKEAVARIMGAGRGMTCAAISSEARALGVAYETMRTLYYRWLGLRKHGREEEALIDRRKIGRAGRANLWTGIYMHYCENDMNTSKNAWDVMMRDFRTGTVDGGAETYADVFRAVGTWREVWQTEHPLERLPSGYPSGWVPLGATYQNLGKATAKKNPDKLFQIAMARQGRKAAHGFLLDVLKTRVGVPVGAIRQWDDVWHNFDTRMPGSGEVAQPLEFAGYDVASAYKCDSVMKPRFTRADGRRDNLKEQTFRFAVGAAHCVTGFHKDGTTNIVERGTAAIRDPVRRQIALIPHYGGLIKFTQSGILSEQVHAGLFIGGGAGNFRMKPLVEASHNLLHNATAHLPGNRGRDAEHMHESRGALVRYEESLIEAAKKLPTDMAAMIGYGLLDFEEYTAAFRLVEREFMRSHNHRIEGWDANQVQEYSVALDPTDNDWHNVRGLLDMSPSDARGIADFLANHRTNVRQRYLSRYEVWMSGQADLIRVPLIEMPAFLDERDMIELTVRDNGTIDFSNGYFYGRDKMIYRADTLRTPAGWDTRHIAPRQKVLVKYNPFTPGQVWIISRDNGSTVGMAPIHSRAPMMDQAAVERSMGLQSHDLARKVMPVRGRHQNAAVKRAGRMGRNQAALLGLATCLPVDNVMVSDDGPDGPAESGEFWSDEETDTVDFLQEITTEKE
jgi:hypothetical protein